MNIYMDNVKVVNNASGKKGKTSCVAISFCWKQEIDESTIFDGIAISSKLEYPDLFLTFTCNPTWPEIT